MAFSDERAPLLRLSPRDQEVLAVASARLPVYSMTLPEDFGIAQKEVVPPVYTQVQKPEPERTPAPVESPKKAAVPLPKASGASSKPKERTPEEVEQRFQELLKQYGLSN